MNSPPTSRGRLVSRLLSALALAALGVAIHLGVRALGRSREAALPDLGPAPAFALTAHDGARVTEADYKGTVWVANFVFLRCGGTCPLMTRRMAELSKRLADAPRVAFVSFDVDPEHDALEDLRAYAATVGAAAPRWRFLRAESRAAIRTLSREGFKLALEDGDPKDPEPILHSTRFVLVDAASRLRGFYDSDDPTALDRLARDARRLSR